MVSRSSECLEETYHLRCLRSHNGLRPVSRKALHSFCAATLLKSAQVGHIVAVNALLACASTDC